MSSSAGSGPPMLSFELSGQNEDWLSAAVDAKLAEYSQHWVGSGMTAFIIAILKGKNSFSQVSTELKEFFDSVRPGAEQQFVAWLSLQLLKIHNPQPPANSSEQDHPVAASENAAGTVTDHAADASVKQRKRSSSPSSHYEQGNEHDHRSYGGQPSRRSRDRSPRRRSRSPYRGRDSQRDRSRERGNDYEDRRSWRRRDSSRDRPSYRRREQNGHGFSRHDRRERDDKYSRGRQQDHSARRGMHADEEHDEELRVQMSYVPPEHSDNECSDETGARAKPAGRGHAQLAARVIKGALVQDPAKSKSTVVESNQGIGDSASAKSSVFDRLSFAGNSSGSGTQLSARLVFSGGIEPELAEDDFEGDHDDVIHGRPQRPAVQPLQNNKWVSSAAQKLLEKKKSASSGENVLESASKSTASASKQGVRTTIGKKPSVGKASVVLKNNKWSKGGKAVKALEKDSSEAQGAKPSLVSSRKASVETAMPLRSAKYINPKLAAKIAAAAANANKGDSQVTQKAERPQPTKSTKWVNPKLVAKNAAAATQEVDAISSTLPKTPSPERA